MQAGKRYSFFQTMFWTKKYIFVFLLYDFTVVALHKLDILSWLTIPWQPISLIGIAVAFYLGFKNNSAYERVWEARKIWGGIVNTSRAYSVMARDFVNNDEAVNEHTDAELISIRKRLIYRHIAWLNALAIELRKLQPWEHNKKHHKNFRNHMGTTYSEEKFELLKPYLSDDDYKYIMSKGNKSSHLLSLQSKDLSILRRKGIVEHFRHLEIQSQITELYALQGKSERIKNFPFPRQYATVNYFFVILFIILLPFGMQSAFTSMQDGHWFWTSVIFSVVGSWVFWMMEIISEFSENPFEGLFNDVPITSMARSIEIDIRQMIEDEDIPDAIKPSGEFNILV